MNLAPAHATGVGSSTLGFLNQFISAICVQAMGLVGVGSPLPMLLFCVGAALFQLVVMRLSPRMEATGPGHLSDRTVETCVARGRNRSS